MFSLICGSALALSVYSHWSATMGPYLMSTTADGPQTYAILISVNGIVVLLANPIVRRMIARIGGLSGLLAGCIMLCASQIGFAISTALPALMASMVLLSIAEVLVVLAELVLVDTLVSGPRSGSYFGAHAISHAGNFFGAIIGGLTLAAFGGPAMFLLFALIALASALIYSIAFRTLR
ncbi:MFS transporter [Neorhizobium sp. BT27B]|uniref:MFS transporter n=1 Tax=Neorhizobium sp. BT27B TaxID=3142625 RepID=UPI003D2DCE41